MKKETAIVRIFITEELKEVMEEHYGKLYKKQWSDGLKADLYNQFGVEAPQPPSELEKKLEQAQKLQEEIENLRKVQEEMDKQKAQLTASKAGSPQGEQKPAENKTSEAQSKPAQKPSEQSGGAQSAQKPSGAQRPAQTAKK